jgi:mannose/fructose/N-acetylgalactosamine-specific phosphotransferase system component IIC
LRALLSLQYCRSGLRPEIAAPNLERFAAFAVLGLLLGMAYPGRPAFFALLIVAAAVALEFLQLFTPDRDAVLVEMLVKAAGGLAGMGFAVILSRVFPRKDCAIQESCRSLCLRKTL